MMFMRSNFCKLCVHIEFLCLMQQSISTRERDVFRDNVVGLVANKISAGVSVGVGGHDEEKKGDEQFEISDERSVEDVHTMILNKSLQPVYSNFIRV